MMQSWLHHCESTDRKSTRDRNLRLSNEMHKLCVDTLKMKRNPLFQPQKLYQVSLLHLGKRRIKHPPRGSLMRRNNCSTKSAMMQVIARVVCLFFIHSSSPSCESLTAAAAAAEAKRNGIFSLLGLSFCCCSNSQQCTIWASSLSLSFTCITVANQLLFVRDSTDRHDGSSSSKSKYFPIRFACGYIAFTVIVLAPSWSPTDHFRAAISNWMNSSHPSFLPSCLFSRLCRLMVMDWWTT